jgi:hypothetical protein
MQLEVIGCGLSCYCCAERTPQVSQQHFHDSIVIKNFNPTPMRSILRQEPEHAKVKRSKIDS